MSGTESLREFLCPICRQALREGDELIARWYAPKQWFVLYHVEAEKAAAFHEHLAYGGEAEVQFARCGVCVLSGWPV